MMGITKSNEQYLSNLNHSVFFIFYLTANPIFYSLKFVFYEKCLNFDVARIHI